jgi:hypothetical protein
MFENEGTEIESTQSDVSEESSSGTQTDTQAEATKQAAPQAQEVPFHEHPRWKEVMEERNAEKQRAASLEQQLQQMQRQLQESSKPKSDKPDFNTVRTKMGERLKGIDPEFQEYMSLLEEQALNANKALDTFREERHVESLKSKFEDLSAKSSLSPAIKQLYFAHMDAEYRAGRLSSVDALEKTFSTIHSGYAKEQEALKRAAIEEYTKAKKADASKPSTQPKGKSPQVGKVDTSKMSPEQAKQAMNKHIVSLLREGREV